MDRAALVHLAVDVLEELRAEVVAEVRPFVDRAAVLCPGGVERLRRVVAEAVAKVVRFERAVEEEDAGGERVREIVLRRVEDAFTVRAEATEGDAERVAHVVGRRLGVVLRFVRRKRSRLRGDRPRIEPTPEHDARGTGPGR